MSGEYAHGGEVTKHDDGIECECPACGHRYAHGGEVESEKDEGETGAVEHAQRESFSAALKRRKRS